MKQAHVTAGYIALFNPSSDGGFEVSFPDFPGCVTFGHTFE
ncbi:MAG TPA: type II toxin-antitoxin system HicB family antitoxin [Verrucomicrobiae bacterium]|nr:type II toxin-antitoxin system HicB family antitoxin [Verrucomicrobiae bacterium]